MHRHNIPGSVWLSIFSTALASYLSLKLYQHDTNQKYNCTDATYNFTHSLSAVWTVPCRTWIIHICLSHRWIMAFLMIQGVAFNTFHQLIACNNVHTPVQTNEVSIYNEYSMKYHVPFIWEAVKSLNPCSEIWSFLIKVKGKVHPATCHECTHE